jgi:hypothetical protein
MTQKIQQWLEANSEATEALANGEAGVIPLTMKRGKDTLHAVSVSYRRQGSAEAVRYYLRDARIDHPVLEP